MKIVRTKLREPMTQHDFEQMTLLANMIAICEIVIKREPKGTERRQGYALLHRDAKRIENSIPGHVEGRSIEASIIFYNDLHDAVEKFLKSFNVYQPPIRGADGKFKKKGAA